MTKEYCDICGKEINLKDNDSWYKMKKLTFSWHESWWEKLHVHNECWKDICTFFAKLHEQDGEQDVQHDPKCP